MAKSNNDLCGEILTLVRDGLRPFVARTFEAAWGQDWADKLAERWRTERPNTDQSMDDVAMLLKTVFDHFPTVFRSVLDRKARSWVSELMSTRNDWAHQKALTFDDVNRAADTAHLLLQEMSAPEAIEVEKLRLLLLRQRFDQQSRREAKRQGQQALLDTPSVAGLKPWRDVAPPHSDVAAGRFTLAEFAADLGQVFRGDAIEEYGDPEAFFRRTYLTQGLRQLLELAVKRASGLGGEPIVDLQTNFGGGKTHSMIGLFHLFGGQVPAAKLAGIDELLKELSLDDVPTCTRAVLVGTEIRPGETVTKPDGSHVSTIWGELAWQLGGAEGYAIVADADRARTSPGGSLRELIERYSPCLILIDEWVAYARQLRDDDSLPGGSFETQMTFAQTLSEAVKAVPNALLVASLPASDLEVGGDRGVLALRQLGNIVKRTSYEWRPADMDESYEIVRRRLFEPIEDAEQIKHRDAVIRVFRDAYRNAKAELPNGVSEAEYADRMQRAYPIHPEVFDRLYENWSTLERFQRTRGVLRMLATVIRALWEAGDTAPMILPGLVPVHDSEVSKELSRYLSPAWPAIIDSDVDGANSVSARIDAEFKNLGKFRAARRVARTLLLGSAPYELGSGTDEAETRGRGLDEKRIRLGCLLPGEQTSTYDDALRKLTQQTTYLFSDASQWWWGTTPTVAKIAKDRAQAVAAHVIIEEIERQLREGGGRGDFAGVHVAPPTSGDVPDEPACRLVILSPSEPWSKEGASAAIFTAVAILDQRGTSPRIYRNALIFLAAEGKHLPALELSVRNAKSWESILDDRDSLNLSVHSIRQAEGALAAERRAIKARIDEAYRRVLVPHQASPDEPVLLEAATIKAGDRSLAERVSERLATDGLLTKKLGATTLRHELDRIPLWRGNHVEISQLAEDFARYPYLTRVASPSVVRAAAAAGPASTSWMTDTFAYAEGWDEATGRYLNLVAGAHVDPANGALLVQSNVASAQLAADAARASAQGPTTDDSRDVSADGSPAEEVKSGPTLHRYLASARLDPLTPGKTFAKIQDEILRHLGSAKLTLRLEIETEPTEMTDAQRRTLTENTRVLGLDGGIGHE